MNVINAGWPKSLPPGPYAQTSGTERGAPKPVSRRHHQQIKHNGRTELLLPLLYYLFFSPFRALLSHRRKTAFETTLMPTT